MPNESETPKIPDAVNGTEGVDFVTIAGLKWAKWNIGASGFNSTYFDSMYDVFCPDGVLAPAYDTATSNWGETWRMPTAQDYANMANATYWAWKSGGYYVFNPTENHVAGSFDDDFPDDLDVTDAILFFPGCGYGANNEHNMIRRYGYFWTSNYGSYPSMAFAFSTYFTFISIGPNHIYYGLPVRAVSDY